MSALRRCVIAACLVTAGIAPAAAAAAITGQVIRQSDGRALAGAVVTVAGPGQAPLDVRTDAAGNFSASPSGGGPFGVGISSPGLATQSVGGVAADASVGTIALAPATFTPLPVDGGPTNAIAADAVSGVFYTLMMGAPEVYRTLDYGGSWQQVTASYDDAQDGLLNSNSRNLLAVSSVSGELAIGAEGYGVSYSTDYGVTWKKVPGPDFNVPAWAPRRDPRLFWGHAAPTALSVLLFADRQADGSWNVWRADMAAPQPTWVKEPSDPFGAGSEIAEADSRSGSFIARVSAGGELSFAALTATGAIGFGSAQAGGLPAPPRLVQLGGPKEDAAPPDAMLAVGGTNDPPQAQMLTKAAGATSFDGASASAATTLADNCMNPGPVGTTEISVTPTSSGTDGAGSVGRCWLIKSGSGSLDNLSVGGAGVAAYDANWGHDNFVAFEAQFTFGGATLGPWKYARTSPAGAPVIEIKPASGGTDPGSGGYSLHGLTSAGVSDTAYGPAGSSEEAVAMITDALASKGGAPLMPILPRGSEWSNAVQWWQGASGDWLVFGHAGRCTAGDPNDHSMLTALLGWNGADSLAEPNVGASRCAELGGPQNADISRGPRYGVTALQGVPGSDTVFIGLGGFDPSDSRHIYRAALVPGTPPSLSGATALDTQLGLSLPNTPTAMAYCPSIAGDSDVLFVALGVLYEHGTDVPGGLVRITGATTAQPSGGLVDSIPHGDPQSLVADVRADCASGTVYAGGYNGIKGIDPQASSDTAFFKSTDGGRTFTRIAIPGPDGQPIGEIAAIGVNPADPNDVKVAAGGSGLVVHTGDGGLTWTVVNDPAVSRNNRVNDIEYPPAASAASRFSSVLLGRASALGILAPLVGTSGGAFHGDLTATSGMLAVSTTSSGAGSSVGARLTTLLSDNRPTAALTPAGPTAIFHRSNGLALSSLSRGTWSQPEAIPGTTSRDDFAAAATNGATRLQLAFARRGAGAGIYVTTRAPTGSWTAPRRISSRAGDTLPAIAMKRAGPVVALLRSGGSARGRGVYYVASRGSRWSRAVRIPGTTAGDARVAFGGPALDAAAGRPEVVFGRGGRRPGIYYAALSGSRWKIARLTKGRGDAQPAIVAAGARGRLVVFRRRAGLFVLRGGRTWTLARLRGTIAGDRDATLAPTRANVLVAFSRPSGKDPGIRWQTASFSGRIGSPLRRASSSAADRNASLAADPQGHVTIVFERG